MDEIIIADLAEPELSELQQGARDFGESLTVTFVRDEILQEARDTTGHSDFGSMDFVQRLDLLCQDWGGDPGLTGIGRYSLRSKLVDYAKNRLLIQNLLSRHPEIHDIEIARPIIVAGLPRSGTTHLLNLMAADTRFRSLPYWESLEPVPMPAEASIDGIDPRYQRCAEAWDMTRQMVPHLAAMHPLDPDHINEEIELMLPDFASYIPEWIGPSERFRDHYYATDQTPHYEYMKTVLKVLTFLQPADQPTRWVLKSPQHLEQLPVLHKVFPDATIAVTYRDPVSVIQSTITMLAYGQRLNRYKIQIQELGAYWSNRIEHLLRACVADRGKLPADSSIDVPFHEFMADDLAMVEKIYATAGVEMTDKARTELQQYLADHPRGKEGKLVYDLQGQFGIDPKQLRERFQFYFDAFPQARGRAE